LTIIATVEAYRMCGYETTMNSIRAIYEDIQKAVEANRKDNEVDEDNNGVADVSEISNKQLVQRKILLYLKVINPKRLSDALAGINAGFLAVLATLHVRLAKAITLGSAIGTAIEIPIDKHVLPHLEKAMPPEYRKWAKPAVSYAIKSVTISLAWLLLRIISAFHSAIRGGLMFSRNILHYLSEMKYVQINHEETILDEVVGYSLALLGLLYQVFYGFALPFPFKIILFPFMVVEICLMAIIRFV